MKLLYLFCFSFIILSCNTNSKNKAEQQKEEINPIKKERQQAIEPITLEDTLCHAPQPYFEFDNVLHYNSGLRKGIASELYETKDKSQKKLAQFLTIVRPERKSLKDYSIIKLLGKADFKLDTIPKVKHHEINNIFSKKTDAEGEGLACIAEYNDYFVFKLKNKITGIALICFGCGQSRIIGSKVKTYNFGVGGEFSKLKMLVK